MNASFLQELLNTIAERGRLLLPRSLFKEDTERGLQALVLALVSERGEASGVAIAQQLLHHYKLLGDEERRAFFRYLAETLRPRSDVVAQAARAYLDEPSAEALTRLRNAVESPLQEFFRRLNLAPGATADIVAMRSDLLRLLKDDPALPIVDDDLRHLLYSWFNRGFLVLRRIDWQTPAAILDKIIAYEAVHEIAGWDDLRRRLDAADRRCFAFFHPSLVDDPLIFVEVALMHEVPTGIAPILNEPAKSEPITEPTTAVFYSISNCQEGLKRISFGNFLIKQVVEDLRRELPSLSKFVTLSPVPNFADWLEKQRSEIPAGVSSEEYNETLKILSRPDWFEAERDNTALKASVLALAADYFLRAKGPDNKPVDPVARFHLGNGARLESINWLGDTSAKAIREGHGLMVNYLYEIKDIEKNHETYANDGPVPCSRAVKGLLRAPKSQAAKSKTVREPLKALAPPREGTEEDQDDVPTPGAPG